MKSRKASETRSQYLINYRNGLWTQIRAKEESVWRFISYYSAALLLALNFGLSATDFSNSAARAKLIITLIILLLVSFWGLFITLDSNFWFQRNLIIIRNIEKIMLYKRDFGLIIPRSFGDPFHKYNYTTFTRIQNAFFSFFIALTVLAIIFFSQNQTDPTLQILVHLSGILFPAFLISVINKNMDYVNRLYRVQEAAPGTFLRTDLATISRDFFVNETLKGSCLETYFSFMTLIGIGGCGVDILNYKEVISDFLSVSPTLGVITPLIFVIILIATFIVYLKNQKTSAFSGGQVQLSMNNKYFLRSFAIITIGVCSFFMLVIGIYSYIIL